VAPPVLALLEALAGKPLDAAVEEMRAMPAEFEGSGRPIRFAPGYDLLPLETPPLPADIPTNVVIAGLRRFVVIDPAPRPDKGKRHLFEAIDARLRAGDELAAVVLTHHHPDHVGALEETVARYGAPIWAHRRTGELLGRGIDRPLEEGDEIDLGAGLDGRPGWTLRALFTPGHSEDHLVFHDERTRSLVAGDLLSSLVSMYVGSPGGNLRQYFAALDRVRALPVDTFYPSHGAPGHDLAGSVEETLRHRKERIEEIRGRLGPIARSAPDLAREVYATVNPALRPLFERTTRAALEHLAEDGRAIRAGEDAYRAP
jgi:glyoxylase-like metal-dependent hydrolase (beta-lactamase superfamily II)